MRGLPRFLVLVTAALAGLLLAAACGEEVKAQLVTVEGTEFAFIAPQTMEAGLTTITLKNVGQQPHILTLVRLEEGKTLQDVIQEIQTNPDAPPPSWATVVPGPGVVGPGGSSNSTLVLAPGPHVMLCFVPDPADGQPHVAKGMIGTFTVTGKAQTVDLPKATATVRMKDFAFEMPALTKGSVTLRVVNDGSQDHEFQLFTLAPGKSAQDVFAWFAQPSGPPPVGFAGGISGMAKGLQGNTQVDFSAGNYLAVCVFTDPATKKSHVELGMLAPFTIQ